MESEPEDEKPQLVGRVSDSDSDSQPRRRLDAESGSEDQSELPEGIEE